MPATIDYYFSIGSPWAYLGLRPLRDLAARHGREIVPHAVGIIRENGAIPGRERPAARQAYGQRDLARWAEWHGRPLRLADRPALDDPSPAARSVIALALDGQGWLALTLALHEAYWERVENIADPEIRRQIADAAGFDGAALIAREAAADVTERLETDLREAREAGIFGSPTYVIDGEAYWGQDRLPFVERHLESRPLTPGQ